MKYEKLSTLIPILKSITEQCINPEVVRKLAISKINESKVNPASKKSMIKILNGSEKPLACVYNLILKYEGNGVIR